MATPLYVPIVRSKQSEMLGLQHLDPSIKERIYPLVDLAAPSKEKDKVHAIKFVEKNITGLSRYLKGFPMIMLDSSEMNTGIRLTKGRHPLREAASLLVDAGIGIIPVVGLSRDEHHFQAAESIAKKSNERIVTVRLDDYDLDTPNDSASLLKELMQGVLRDFRIYILYDFRDVYGKDSTTLANRAATLTAKLTDINPIATIVAGCGIPERIVQAVSSRSSDYISRVEIDVWKEYQKICKTRQLVIPGDYTTVTPDHTELDWRIIHKTMGPKIIYALRDQWFVIRGGAFEKHPLGWDQYFELARSVSMLPEYPGEDFCYGDLYIGERSRKQGTCGSPGSWITACVNRHVTLTVHTLNQGS